MTHKSEDNFSDGVEEELVECYGEENVERQVYLAESGRYADFIVDGPLFRLAIEVENDWESAIGAVGQAQLYAGHYADAVPVVIIPEGHKENPEYELLRNRVLIVEM